jgi:hypothetical protein
MPECRAGEQVMPVKRKLSTPNKRKRATSYSSLEKARASARRVAREVVARGVGPLTAEEFDRQMAEPSPWPNDDFEAFLAWRRKSRRTGRYGQ